MRKMIIAGVIATGVASGCDVAPDPDICGAKGYEGLIGSNVAAVSFPADLLHRIIPPDGVVTMDFVPERLNIRVDESGIIERFDCG